MLRACVYQAPDENSRDAQIAKRLTQIAYRVQALRNDMEYRSKLTARIENEQQNIRRELKAMGYRGQMPWKPVRAGATIVPFPADSKNEEERISGTP